ncbi:MAG: LysM peptidoglycan-binding domain-containing protein, partial [Candidatus Paceibacterota bacterium]
RKQKVQKKEIKFSFSAFSRKYTPLVYGALTVLVLLLLAFATVKFVTNKVTLSIGDDGISTKTVSKYVVQEGDTLWSISEKTYSDGYSWTEIAKANNIKNPSEIEKGQKLILPTVSEAPEEASVSPTPSQNIPEQTQDKIIGSYYTVQEGDSLWTIAVRAYGDGYKWVDIANRNQLANPDLIHPGNQFVLPR